MSLSISLQINKKDGLDNTRDESDEGTINVIVLVQVNVLNISLTVDS